jgi:flavin-binding protein dodecin
MIWLKPGRNSRGETVDQIQAWEDRTMKDHVYKILELVGSSDQSIEAAIQNAIARAKATIRDMRWFEVVQTRGHIENGTVHSYQVTVKVGFTLETS